MKCPKCGRKKTVKENGKTVCPACGEIGTVPLCGGEEYPKIVRSIHFAEGDLFNWNKEITIEKEGTGAKVTAMPGIKKTITGDAWKEIINRLYYKLYLHEWKKRFTSPRTTCQWKLEIGLKGGRKRTCYGNTHPPYWAELKEIFKPYFLDAGKEGIHAFAEKWLDAFKGDVNDDGSFSRTCSYFGFTMDCGESFEKKYPGAFTNPDELERIIGEVKDVKLLGSAIFSRWRYAGAHKGDKKWFEVSLKRLAELTE